MIGRQCFRLLTLGVLSEVSLSYLPGECHTTAGVSAEVQSALLHQSAFRADMASRRVTARQTVAAHRVPCCYVTSVLTAVFKEYHNFRQHSIHFNIIIIPPFTPT